MIARCAEGITGWLIRHEAIRESDRELYVYAAYSFLITISPLFLTIIIGTLFGRTGQSIFLIIPFLVIRKFSGGIHAKYAWVCFICSCLLLLICIGLSGQIACDWKMALATGGAILSLSLLSPVDSENRRLEKDEQKRYKMVTMVLAVGFGAVGAILSLCGQDRAVVCISLGIILTAVLQLPCIFLKIYLFFQKNDQNR